jgi:chromosome segregation ATPase
LQEAGGSWRKLVEELSRGAEEILQTAGHSPSRSHLDQVQNTLLATATDQQVRDQVLEGRLEKEAQPPSGFGGLAEAAGGTVHQLKPARPDPQDRKRERAGERAEELERQANEAESEARRLQQELGEAEQRTRKARTAAERAEAKAGNARERATRARLETR